MRDFVGRLNFLQKQKSLYQVSQSAAATTPTWVRTMANISMTNNNKNNHIQNDYLVRILCNIAKLPHGLLQPGGL